MERTARRHEPRRAAAGAAVGGRRLRTALPRAANGDARPHRALAGERTSERSVSPMDGDGRVVRAELESGRRLMAASPHGTRRRAPRRCVVRAPAHKQLVILLAVAFGATFLNAHAARAVETPQPVGDAPIVVSADRVEYYSDIALVVARGEASVA